MDQPTPSLLIAPSIVSCDHARLVEEIRTCEAAGADWLHVDVMDGHFVPNLTMGPFLIETYRRESKLPLDVHLMIEEPERWLKTYAETGASLLSVHVEATLHIHRTLQMIHEVGCKAGVVLNPGTPVATIEPVLHLVDLVLVMSVNPGFSGQKFLPEALPKIAQVRRALDQFNPAAQVQIDGGITAQTLPLALQAGAQVFVAATSIFKHPQGAAAGIAQLRQAMQPSKSS